VPDRVKWIRVLLAELQRLNSHLVWLGTHALDLGAASVMMYCFREREKLLNVNEMIAGFRLFPSYHRVGGLREDLPTGFHEVRARVPRALPERDRRVRAAAHEERHLPQAHDGYRLLSKEDTVAYGLVGPMARSAGVTYDVRRAFPYLVYDQCDFEVPTRTEGDVYARYLVRVAEMRESVKICRQALDRITPTGEWAIDDPRITPPTEGPRLLGDGGAHPALPALLAGLHGAGRRGGVPHRGAARRARRST
jgi:NADH-quinone oxidoreductase subunit D